jgi:hypothetical protein
MIRASLPVGHPDVPLFWFCDLCGFEHRRREVELLPVEAPPGPCAHCQRKVALWDYNAKGTPAWPQPVKCGEWVGLYGGEVGMSGERSDG